MTVEYFIESASGKEAFLIPNKYKNDGEEGVILHETTHSVVVELNRGYRNSKSKLRIQTVCHRMTDGKQKGPQCSLRGIIPGSVVLKEEPFIIRLA